MKKQQSGFTLVELVTTITIVGVLAAVAVPRFANISSDARAGVIKNLASAMQQTNDTIYSKAATLNITSLPGGTSGLSGGSVNIPDGKGGVVQIFTHFGYASNATQLYNAMVQHPDLAVGLDGLAVGADRITELQKYNGNLLVTDVIGPNGAIQNQKVQTATKCEVGYTQAKNANTAPIYITVIIDCS